MSKPLEIRWHGRGGQGVKTSATFLADAIISSGKYGQGFPEYGPERRGAPIKGFTRISNEPIKMHCAVYNPEIVVVVDPTLLSSINVKEGLIENGTIIVNTQKSVDDLRKQIDFDEGTVGVVDATNIAIEEIGRPIPNTPMLGALMKVTDILDLDTLLTEIRKKFAKKFDEKMIEGNINAIKRAYKEVEVK